MFQKMKKGIALFLALLGVVGASSVTLGASFPVNDNTPQAGSITYTMLNGNVTSEFYKTDPSGYLTSPVVKEQDVIGADILTDGIMNSWVIAPTGTSVGVFDLAGGDDPSNIYIPTRSTVVGTGTYSLKFSGNITGNIGSYFEVSETGLTPADSIVYTIESKATATGVFKVLASYEVGEATWNWNWTGASANTFTEEGVGGPSADQLYTVDPTASFADTVLPAIIVPAGGAYSLAFLGDSDVYIDNLRRNIAGAGNTVLESFETWTLFASPSQSNSNLLYNFDLLEGGSSTFGTSTREATIVPTGATYSYKLVAGSNGVYTPMIIETGLTPGAYYDLTVNGYAPTANATGSFGGLIINGPIATATQYYDDQALVWVTDTVTNGTFTASETTDAWVEWTNRIVVPASGTIVFVPLIESQTEGDILYVGKMTLEPVTIAPAADPFKLINASDISDMTDEDTQFYMQFEDAEGEATNPTIAGKFLPIAYTYNSGIKRIMLYTDADNGFYPVAGSTSTAPAAWAVGTPAAPYDALNSLNTLSILATSTAVNMKTVAITTLYTVPAGYALYLDHVDFVPTIDTLTDAPIFQMGGNNPNYNNYNSWPEIVSDDWTTGQLISLMAGATTGASYIVKAKYAAGDEFKVNVTTGAVATTYTGIFRVFGYLVATP